MCRDIIYLYILMFICTHIHFTDTTYIFNIDIYKEYIQCSLLVPNYIQLYTIYKVSIYL